MAEANVLASRVTGAQSELPRHPRVPHLTVGSVLRERPPGLLCIDSGLRSLEALVGLAERNLEAALVMDAGEMVGIFSLADFARSTVGAGLQAMTTPVLDVMAACSFQVSPDDSAQNCLNLMDKNRLNFMPVQENGKVVALLSRVDLLGEMLSHYERIFRESALDQQILFLRGTYSC